MKGNVLITDNLDPVCAQILTDHGFTADTHTGVSHEELLKLAPTADAWIVRSGTKITADLIDAAERLQVIGRAGVGVDNIDLEAATRRGVLVINAPDGNTISTAEHTCAMMMASLRMIPQAVSSLKGGEWNRKAFKGAEVNGKTIGIIGVGKIGQAVAERMKTFGVELLGYDPVLSKEMAARVGVTLVTLDELLERSDIITVHTPMSDSTRGLLNRGTLARCRDGVYIVNCARGGIVDEKDLLEALESGKVAGAAVDVYSSEPPPEGLSDLIAHPKVVSTPHIAAS
ncbi:MAG: hydroxyacid dehydrogenase, partial [Rhodothermales bacterium]|nr:hydroxyacid dehydrogenase [Rhodothermales bacterium]